MAKRTTSRIRTREGHAKAPNPTATTDVLRTLLEALAEALLDSGVTPSQVAEIAKDALVAQASRGAYMATGRVNHSKVAALTGLSRAEVRRKLAEASRSKRVPLRALDRTSRVIAGWRRDPDFLRRDGTPRSLPLKDTADGFPALVRRHSGDIPPRAVLDAMLSRGLATQSNNTVSLRRNPTDRPVASTAALTEAIPYIGALLSTASSRDSKLSYAHALEFVADDAADEILLTDHLVRTLATAIGAMKAKKRVRRVTSSAARSVRVTLALLSSPRTPKP